MSENTANTVDDPRTQARYQVRLDWGAVGAARIASGADATIWVDQLGRDQRSTDQRNTDQHGAPDAAIPTVDTDFLVRGSLQNAAAVARWVLAQQEERGGRFVVSVIAAGVTDAAASLDPNGAAEPRFAVEDLFGAGAIVSALTDVGLDHSSPEAAAAAAAYLGLRSGLKHLVKNSVAGIEQGITALDLTPVDDVEVLRAP